MSVLIKGMEKPKSCTWWDGRCPLLGDDDDCKLQDCQEEWTWQDQYKGCPLSDAPDTNVDTISRQAAIDGVKILHDVAWKNWHEPTLSANVVIDMIKDLPSAQPEQTRIFVELVVEYPDPELCTYKEYRGKPYYSIKYIENGERYVGFGTYKPEVLSQYLKENFISPAQQDRSCIDQIKWERDTAIQQLNELGYSFGEAIRHDKDAISRKGAINAVCTVLYPDADKMNDAKKVLKEMPSAQPEYYDYSDIEPLWKSFAEENDINLTETAKQLKDAMWCGYRKGKADAQPEQRWVPCSEEPDDDREVFIARGEPKFMSVCIGYYDHDYKQWYESRNWFAKCLYDGLYWCEIPPLPEPYREEGDRW